MLDDLNLPAQVTLAVSVVAALRARVRSIDGWYAVALVAAVSVALALVVEPELTWSSVARHGLLLFLYSLGGMSAAKHVAKAVGQSLGGKKGPADGKPR